MGDPRTLTASVSQILGDTHSEYLRTQTLVQSKEKNDACAALLVAS